MSPTESLVAGGFLRSFLVDEYFLDRVNPAGAEGELWRLGAGLALREVMLGAGLALREVVDLVLRELRCSRPRSPPLVALLPFLSENLSLRLSSSSSSVTSALSS